MSREGPTRSVGRRHPRRRYAWYCLGKCYRAPAAGRDTERPAAIVHAREPVILRNVGEAAAPTLEAYRSRGGYRALERALTQRPEDVVRAVERSELRGRGGAAYPTGRKWRAVMSQPASERYVVANADEGDPGAYIDRFILEDNPHVLIEALAIAAYAIGAGARYIYLRAEYPEARRRLEAAIGEARRAGVLAAPTSARLVLASTWCSESGRAATCAARKRHCSTPSRGGDPRCAPGRRIPPNRVSSGVRLWSTTSRPSPPFPGSSSTAPTRTGISDSRPAAAPRCCRSTHSSDDRASTKSSSAYPSGRSSKSSAAAWHPAHRRASSSAGRSPV